EHGVLKGLITVKDIQKKIQYPNAAKDNQGRLRVAAALGTGPDTFERAEALIAEDVDVLVVDTSHGHSRMVVDSVKGLVATFGARAQFVAGNVATAEGTLALIEAGVNGVKIGIGPGCFAAGTRVLMADAAYKNIEDVRAGDRVINMHGEPVSVVKAWCTGTREVMSLRHTAYFGDTMVTPDHRFFVGDLSTMNPQTVTSRGYAAALATATRCGRSKLGWHEIGAVDRAACLVPNHIAFELPASFTIELAEFAVRRNKQLSRYRRQLEPTYELGYVFGTF